jgi:hypothetical protein
VKVFVCVFLVQLGDNLYWLGFMDVQGCCLLGILDAERLFKLVFVKLEGLFYVKIYGSKML